MKTIGSVLVAAISLCAFAFAGSAEACRVHVPPMAIYERWLSQSGHVFIGRVVGTRNVQWTNADGSVRPWTMPEAEVVGVEPLKGMSPDRMTLQGSGPSGECGPWLRDEISRLQSGDDVLVMLGFFGTTQGVLPLQSEAAQTFIARLRQPDSRTP
jgi:hypothetical protein